MRTQWRHPDDRLDSPAEYPADRLVTQARRAREAGDLEAAIAAYSRVLRLAHRYLPANSDPHAIAKCLSAEDAVRHNRLRLASRRFAAANSDLLGCIPGLVNVLISLFDPIRIPEEWKIACVVS